MSNLEYTIFKLEQLEKQVADLKKAKGDNERTIRHLRGHLAFMVTEYQNGHVRTEFPILWNDIKKEAELAR